MHGWENKAEEVKARYDKLTAELSEPEIYNDQERLKKVTIEQASLKETVTKYVEYSTLLAQYNEANELLTSDDQELIDLAQMEITEIEPELEKLAEEIPRLLLPKDPKDDKNVIVEIRAGTGGDEAALFAADLFRMYTRYAENQNWQVEILSANGTEIGGFKETVFVIEGHGAYSRLKYESGVHRVQRIPVTESGGRIHTSAATVAVLPEVEEVDIDIDPADLRIDIFRSSGPGGQSVNTTDSAVRIVHLPTGITVSCQDEKSQHKNRAKALKILRARVQEMMEAEQQAELDETRKVQIGTGDRSERIRTYNFPQGRITDHRINFTIYQLDEFLNGNMEVLINALSLADQKMLMEKVGTIE